MDEPTSFAMREAALHTNVDSLLPLLRAELVARGLSIPLGTTKEVESVETILAAAMLDHVANNKSSKGKITVSDVIFIIVPVTLMHVTQAVLTKRGMAIVGAASYFDSSIRLALLCAAGG